MHLLFTFEAPIARTSPEDYVREVLVDVVEYDEFAVEQYLLGRMEFEQVLYSDIQLDGEDAHMVCDEHSDNMEAIWSHFIDRYGDVRPEFEADELTANMLVLNRMVLHPDALPFAMHILEAALNLFGHFTLVVAWRRVAPLPDIELAELGFRKASGTELVYRQSCISRSYERRFPRGFDAIIDATAEHEQWVLDEWENQS